MQNGNAPIIVDVRMPYEWMAMRIGTVGESSHHPTGRAVRQTRSQPPRSGGVQQRLPVEPGDGHLQRRGFKNVASLAGGSAAWIDAGLSRLW